MSAEAEMTETEYRTVIDWIAKPVAMPHETAVATSETLTRGECDGWEYRVVRVSDTHSNIEVFDDTSSFLGYFGI